MLRKEASLGKGGNLDFFVNQISKTQYFLLHKITPQALASLCTLLRAKLTFTNRKSDVFWYGRKYWTNVANKFAILDISYYIKKKQSIIFAFLNFNYFLSWTCFLSLSIKSSSFTPEALSLPLPRIEIVSLSTSPSPKITIYGVLFAAASRIL